MNARSHIFLSYRSSEADFALQLAADLKNAGVNLWMDRLDIKPGDDWRNSLQAALYGCAAVISILSPEYVRSKYCKRELARADRLGQPIFPVVLGEVPPQDWPLEIERHQYIDFSGWHDKELYRENLTKLVDILKDRFAAQISVVPDPETQYLTHLLAELEAHKGLMGQLEIATEVEKGPPNELVRPEPHATKARAMQGMFELVQLLSVDDAPPRQRRITLKQIQEVVREFPRFVLIGDPGVGKTTTLHSMVLDSIYARQSAHDETPLPLLLNLVNWSENISIEDFLRANWPIDTDPIKLLEKGKIVLYLDGLNEIVEDGIAKARHLREWLSAEHAPQKVIITCRASEYQDDFDLGLPVVRIKEMDATLIRQFVNHYLDQDAAEILLARILPQDEREMQPSRHVYQLARNPLLLSALMLIYKSSAISDLPYTTGMLLRRLANRMWEHDQARRATIRIAYKDLEAGLADLAYEMVEADMPAYVPVEDAVDYLGGEHVLQAAANVNFLTVSDKFVRFSYQYMYEYFASLRLLDVGVSKRLTAPQLDESGRRIRTKWDQIVVALSGFVSNPDAFVWSVAEIDPFLGLECIASGTNVDENTLQRIINHLLNMMRSTARDGRVATAQILSKIDHESAISIVLEALRDGTWEVRRAALSALHDIEIPSLPGLTETLQELEDDIREATLIGLRQLGESALPTLLRLLQDEQWILRRSAAWALGELRDKAGVPGLVDTLYDADTLVSTEAAIALGQIKDRAALPWLLKALHHENWRVRNAASRALGALGRPAVEGLLNALKEADNEVRRLAISALRSIADPVVPTALLEASHDDSVEVRSAALEAMKDIDDGRIVKRFIECLSDTSRSRWSKQRICDMAARALEAIGTPEALKAVLEWRGGAEPSRAPLPTAEAASEEEIEMDSKKTPAQIVKERLKRIQDTSRLESLPDELLSRLNDNNWITRRDAVLALEKHNQDRALPLLVKALNDEDNQVRIAAVKVLATIENEASIDALLAALGGEDYLVGDMAAEALQIIGKRAVPSLIKALETQNTNTRGSVIEILGKIGDVSAVPPLIKCLSDGEKPFLSQETICEMAAKALELIGSAEALRAVQRWRSSGQPVAERGKPKVEAEVPPHHRQILSDLLETLHQTDWMVQQEAAKALREYAKILNGTKDPVAVQQLLNALKDPDWVVRWSVIEALAWIGDASAVPMLMAMLKDSNWMIRVATIRALLEIGDHSAVDGITRMLNDPNDRVREAAAEVLGGFGAASAVAGLANLLNDGETFVRHAAVVALGKMDEAAALQPLLTALNDSDSNVRWVAAEALTRTTASAAVATLAKHLGDRGGPYWEEKKVGDLVASILERIGTVEAQQALEQWRRDRTASNGDKPAKS